MAKKAGIEVKIESHVKDIQKALKDVIPNILEEWGLAGQRFATEEINHKIYDTPQSPNYKRTGRLRASITYATKSGHSSVDGEADAEDGMQEGQVPDELSAIVGTNVDYGTYVELGTSKMPPRPFLRPAIEGHKEDFRKILESYLT